MPKGGSTRVLLHNGHVDLDLQEAVIGGTPRLLTPNEAALLGWLVQQGGRPATRAQILREVWRYHENVVSRTLDTTVARLRAKIEEDPSRPQHLLTVPGVGYRFAPYSGASTSAGRLDAFLGRTEELALLDRILAEGARLITVAGPGGIGKSRLVRQWAQQRDAMVVDLQPVEQLSGAPMAIAAAMGLSQVPSWATLGALLDARAPAVLVLDRVEHLGAGLAGALDELLGGGQGRAGARLVVVMTSRVPTYVRGERLVELGPMSTAEALQLYQQRSASLDTAMDPGLAELLERLGRIPLAIELAAARSRVLPPTEQLRRLDRALDLLVDPHSEGRSLRQVIAGTWVLLRPGVQRGLRALCTFRGPFTLDAAEAVLGGGDALDRLQALREHSLIVRRDHESGPRLAVLDPIRWFVMEQLPEDPGAAERHARWFATWGEDNRRRTLDRDQCRRRRSLGAEAADLHAALLWALQNGPGDLAARVWLALYEGIRLWLISDELTQRGLAVLARDDLSPAARVRVQMRVADVARVRGHTEEAWTQITESLRLAEELGDPEQIAAALHIRGVLCHEQDRPEEAQACCERALPLAQAAGARDVEVVIRISLGNIAQISGQHDLAREHLLAAVEGARAIGNPWTEALATGNLANVFHDTGHLDAAVRAWEAALAGHQQVGNRRAEALVLGNWASLDLQLRDLPRAEARLRRALEMHRLAGSVGMTGAVLTTLADVCRLQGKSLEAHGYAREAATIGRQTSWRTLELVSEAGLCEIEASIGDPTAPLQRIVEVERQLYALGQDAYARLAACRRARMLLARGDRVAAYAVVHELQAGHPRPGTELASDLEELIGVLGANPA